MTGPKEKDQIDLEVVRSLVDQLPETVRENLGHGAVLRITEMKALHKKTAKAGHDTSALDADLELLEGTKERSSLISILGIRETADPGKPVDPDQTDAFPQDAPDCRGWTMDTPGVRKLVAQIINEAETEVQAVRLLTNLEEGEKKREPKPRASVFTVIRDARAPLVDRVRDLTIGGAELSVAAGGKPD